MSPTRAASTQRPDLAIVRVDTSQVQWNCGAASLNGTLSVAIANGGAVDVTRAYDMVVFDDRDHDGAYLPSHDETLARVPGPALAAGTMQSVSAPISGDFEFAGAPVLVVAYGLQVVDEVDEIDRLAAGAREILACEANLHLWGKSPIIEVHGDRFYTLGEQELETELGCDAADAERLREQVRDGVTPHALAHQDARCCDVPPPPARSPGTVKRHGHLHALPSREFHGKRLGEAFLALIDG